MQNDTLLITSKNIKIIVECEDPTHGVNVLNSSKDLVASAHNGEGDMESIVAGISHMTNCLNREVPHPHTESIQFNLGYDHLLFQYTRNGMYIHPRGRILKEHTHNSYSFSSNGFEFIFNGTCSPGSQLFEVKATTPNDLKVHINSTLDPYPYLQAVKGNWYDITGNSIEHRCTIMKSLLIDLFEDRFSYDKKCDQKLHSSLIGSVKANDVVNKQESK